MDEVKKIYANIQKKMKKSDNLWLWINIVSFFLSSSAVILNLLMIRFNPFRVGSNNGEHYHVIRMIFFVALSIFTALSTTIVQIISFFVFRKRSLEYGEKKRQIQEEQRHYKKSDNEYANLSQKEKDKLLSENVLNIIKR